MAVFSFFFEVNNQYGFPEVDGPEAMRRVRKFSAAVFLVCEMESKVVGAIRGNHDGSRAIIHQLYVHPAYQRKGIMGSSEIHFSRGLMLIGSYTMIYGNLSII